MDTTTGAEQAIAQLYELYAPSLRHYLARLTGSHEEAERRKTEGYPPPIQVLNHLADAIFLDVLDDDVRRLRP